MPLSSATSDLLDLKLLPAWLKESSEENIYADFRGEDAEPARRGGRRDEGDRGMRGPRPAGRREERRPPGGGDRDRQERRPFPARRDERPEPVPIPQVGVHFLPNARALESVLAQMKSSHVAYSVFALARMFLEKPERYEVRVARSQAEPLFQLGEHGAVAAERRLLEGGAFEAEKENFYKVEITQTEPIKGNFSNVARCKLSSTLLGPTNHHAYQPQLRSLYEQRFSRRMSFADYQRQIEIVTDPEVVERWKEEARSVTTYTTLQEEPAVAFSNLGETERHFRQKYLPALIRTAPEMTLGGVCSRNLPDRGLSIAIEQAWAAEMRSPSRMMQELVGAIRNAGLHIFRHRRGMLFACSVRPRPFVHEREGVSPAVDRILMAITEAPGINRKQLADILASSQSPAAQAATGEPAPEAEKAKLALASDLRWLIAEGYLLEFNDGTLDFPRSKPAPGAAPTKLDAAASQPGEIPAAEQETPDAEARPMPAPAAASAEQENPVNGRHEIASESGSTEPPAQERTLPPGDFGADLPD